MDFQSAPRMMSAEIEDSSDQRAAKRFTSLIRAAKLVCAQGEFVCVIRDVSSTGVSVKIFHPLPTRLPMTLELQNGDTFDMHLVRQEPGQASFRFTKRVTIERLMKDDWNYPKRQLRLGIHLPIKIAMLTGRKDAMISNLSQQGARLETDELFAVDQTVRIETDALPEIRATIRWRRDSLYGCVFDKTFSMSEFAHLAVSLQCPFLLEQSYGEPEI